MGRWSRFITKWVMYAFLAALIAWSGFRIFALPYPRPEFGRTFFITVAGRGRAISGYVKPWIGETYLWLWHAILVMLAVLVVTLIVNATIRKMEGSTFFVHKPPKEP